MSTVRNISLGKVSIGSGLMCMGSYTIIHFSDFRTPIFEDIEQAIQEFWQMGNDVQFRHRIEDH